METEWAWAAGVFEGQGSIVNDDRPRLQVRDTDLTLVQRFFDAVGCGRVYGPYGPYKQGQSPHAIWIAEKEAAWIAFGLLEAHLQPETRQRFLEVFGE